MNSERLAELYDNPALLSDSDISMLEQLAEEYPYYREPFILLAKAYFDKKHYRFEESLKQAAIRVKDREWLYNYIHSAPKPAGETAVSETPEIPITPELEAEVQEREAVAEMPLTLHEEPVKEETAVPVNSLTEFLSEDTAEDSEASYGTEELSVEIPAEPELLEHSVESFLYEEPVAANIVQEPVAEFSESSIEVLTEERPETEADEALYGEEELSVEPAEPVLEQEETAAYTGIHTGVPVAEEAVKPHELPEIEFHIPALSDETKAEKEPETAHFTLESDIEEHTEEAYEESAVIPFAELRKHPVYSLDGYLKQEDIPEPFLKPHTEPEPTPALDFFAWLDKGKQVEKSAVTEPAEIKTAPEVQTSGTQAPEKQDKPQPEVKKKKSLNIIEQFISHNPSISRPKKEFFNPENMAKRSEQIDLEMVTETLAAIYYEHGSYDLAIAAYEKLSLQNPGKEAYFASLIQKIKERK